MLLVHSGDEEGLVGPRGLIHSPYFIKESGDAEPTDMNASLVTFTKMPGGETSGIEFVYEFNREFKKFLFIFHELEPIANNLE